MLPVRAQANEVGVPGSSPFLPPAQLVPAALESCGGPAVAYV